MLEKKTRSKTGCRTCRIRKVKCDEEKLPIDGPKELQKCRRCFVARLTCEWKSGPVSRKASNSPSRKNHKTGEKSAITPDGVNDSPLPSPRLLTPYGPGNTLIAANSLVISGSDRTCLDYLQDSTLAVLLGKQWPWSAMAYAYHRIAVKEPMLMSMMLATTASEIHRSRSYDADNAPESPSADNLSDVDGRRHYGRALSSLREALEYDAKSIQRLEAIFITLWMMIDYENRFGNGTAAIDVHVRGIVTLLFNHVVPSLKEHALAIGSGSQGREATKGRTFQTPTPTSKLDVPIEVNQRALSNGKFDERLGTTSIPIFLLWALYFCTPNALFCNPYPSRIDSDSHLFRLFLYAEPGKADLTLPELYKISRRSCRQFWGDAYPAAAQLDDVENLPALTLYHKCHIVQFKITELFQTGDQSHQWSSDFGWAGSPYQNLVIELVAILEEYDSVLSSAKAPPSCEFMGDGRRVIETGYWASITYYGTIVYFYLCLQNYIPPDFTHQILPSLSEAVSDVQELSVNLFQSRPHLLVRIVWPLFMGGVATTDKIYQGWVAIRLRELRRYGYNFARVSSRFDEIIQGGGPFAFSKGQLLQGISRNLED